jgi:hypothetical protein
MNGSPPFLSLTAACSVQERTTNASGFPDTNQSEALDLFFGPNSQAGPVAENTIKLYPKRKLGLRVVLQHGQRARKRDRIVTVLVESQLKHLVTALALHFTNGSSQRPPPGSRDVVMSFRLDP